MVSLEITNDSPCHGYKDDGDGDGRQNYVDDHDDDDDDDDDSPEEPTRNLTWNSVCSEGKQEGQLVIALVTAVNSLL